MSKTGSSSQLQLFLRSWPWRKMKSNISTLRCWLTQTNTYNTLTLSKALILSVLGLKTHQTCHLAQKTFAVTFPSFSFPIGESFSLDVAKLRMVWWKGQREGSNLKNGHKLVKRPGIFFLIFHTSFFKTWHKRLETQNPVAINSILVARCSQRSVNYIGTHTHTYTHISSLAGNAGLSGGEG